MMRVQSAGDASEEGADAERGDFVSNGIYAGSASGHFIVVNGNETASVSRVDQAGDDKNSDRRETPGPAEIGPIRNSRKSGCRAEEIGVLQNHANDFAETERDNCQVIAAQPE